MTNFTLHNGNSAETLKQYPDNHFDSVVTDPPYLINFLGKGWDSENNDLTAVFTECLRVLKPGGYLLSFSAARTYHVLAMMIQNSGFEIKDQLMWLYSSGFPKAQDIGKQLDKKAGKVDSNYKHTTPGAKTDKDAVLNVFGNHPLCPKCGFGVSAKTNCKDSECPLEYKHQSEQGKKWAGWKTALKPAHEPIVMARKPTKLTFADNCLTHGCGALNIDGTRIGTEEIVSTIKTNEDNSIHHRPKGQSTPKVIATETNVGRYPSNVIGEVEGYQKFFYNPKVSRGERHLGHNDPGVLFSTSNRIEALANDKSNMMRNAESATTASNNHPTVKPVELMRWLVKLVTPKGGIVLDPFNGSGSTGMATLAEDCNYVGIDLDANYIEIARKRIEAYRDNDFNIKPPMVNKVNTKYKELFNEE